MQHTGHVGSGQKEVLHIQIHRQPGVKCSEVSACVESLRSTRGIDANYVAADMYRCRRPMTANLPIYIKVLDPVMPFDPAFGN